MGLRYFRTGFKSVLVCEVFTNSPRCACCMCVPLAPLEPATTTRPNPCHSIYLWACRSGQCVDARVRCDLKLDCDDRSDEESCGKFAIPVKPRHWPDAGLMSAQCRRRWANISPASGQVLCLLGLHPCPAKHIYRVFTLFFPNQKQFKWNLYFLWDN